MWFLRYFFVFLPVMALGQIPAANLFLMDIQHSGGQNLYKFSKPKFLTGDNSQGYNNQPVFLDGFLFASCLRDQLQPDIYLFDVENKIRYQLTDSPESEYSPIPTPDLKNLTMVRVSADSIQSQQLWQSPLSLQKPPKLLLDKVFNVGYYCWLNEEEVALFQVGNPSHRLNIYDIKTQTYDPVAKDIGRCLKLSPSGNLCYVDKSDPDKWFIREYNLKTEENKTLVQTLPGSEDYIWTDEGYIIQGYGSRLYGIRPGHDEKWTPLADFSHWGIRKITRLAVEGKKLALVSISESN